MASRRKLGQRANERGIAERFVEFLSTQGIAISELREGSDDDDPDLLCRVDGETHGIEVVAVWQSKQDARAVWAAGEAALYDGVRGPIPAFGPDPELYKHPSGDILVAAVDFTMKDTIKSYAVKTWLILNATGVQWPLHTTLDGPRVVGQLQRPPQYPYIDVYLALSGNAQTQFFRIP